MSRRRLTFAVAGGFAAVLVALAFVLPVPYVVLVPGPVCDTLGSCYDRQVLDVADGADTNPSGHLYLTTVGVIPADCNRQPTLWQALKAWWNRDDAVQPQQVICPPGESSDSVQKQNERDMAQSQRDAETAALLQLGYHPTSKRIVITDVEPGTDAARVLRVGDAIRTVDGKPVASIDAVRKAIGAHAVGDRVRLTIGRGGSSRDVTVTTVKGVGGRPIIGVNLDVRATFDHPKVHFGLRPADVGGPSAGLMFTLGIIDKLTPGDLTGGRTVAGTGTIDGSGRVGPIGGIQQKIAGATGAPYHASVFLTPAADCADAKAVAPSGVTLVKVDTLRTALHALRAIDSGSTSFPRC